MVGLTGCSFLQNDEQQEKIDDLEKQIEELTERLDEEEAVTEENDEDDGEDKDEEMVPEDNEEEEVEEPEADATPDYTGESFINIKSPENQTFFYDEPVRFSGYVSPDTVKITVKATTPSSPNVDDYTLQNYKPGNTSFAYGAKREWNNLEEGTNTYVFTAHFADGTSESTSTTITFIFGDVGKGG